MSNFEDKLQGKTNLLQKLQYFDPNHSRSSKADTNAGHHHFDSYFEYILSIIGFAVGFGSFWRFPYLVYKNGGGAFLIPYFIALVVLGIPLLYLQTVVGQMHQKSVPFIFARINKGYKFLGITLLIVCFNISGYYNIVLTYSYRFLFTAFTSPLPFADQTPFQNKYFTQQILHQSSSISQFGTIQPGLFALYTLSLIICYMIVRNGVKQSGKVVIYTSCLPYIMFIILALRGIFLQGAIDGIKYLIIPDFSKLLKFQIWVDAIVQVFFQFSVAVGGVINFSSQKPKKQQHLNGLYLIPISIISCGLIAALNVFMYLGHFCLKQNLSIHQLSLSGPELSFNIFPKALAILPWSNVWVFVFFVTMVFLGIDTQFGGLQIMYCYLKDQVQQNGMVRVFGRYISHNTAKVLLIFGIMMWSPFLTSSAGIYYLEFFDSFVATIPLSLGAVIEYIFFVKIVPLQQLERESKKYTGEEAPGWILRLLEGRVVIIILLCNLLLALVDQLFFFFKYSFKFYLIGWVITAYPYVIAYFYYRRHKEDKNNTTFAQFKQPRISQL